MKMKIYILFYWMLIALGLSSCKKTIETVETPTLISANGNITNAVQEFRTILGELNTVPGKTIGRREINWDGVPDAFAMQSLPIDFFNPIGSMANQSLQRGLAYEAGGDFRVSSMSFAELSSETPSDLTAFSGSKLFANSSAALWQVGFQVAAESTLASIDAFGAVFVGVDLANTSYLELLNGTQVLGRYYVPPHNSTSNFSFVGVHFKNTRFTHVRIAHGNASIKSGEKDISKGGTKDVVALDDFIYSEPQKNK